MVSKDRFPFTYQIQAPLVRFTENWPALLYHKIQYDYYIVKVTNQIRYCHKANFLFFLKKEKSIHLYTYYAFIVQ